MIDLIRRLLGQDRFEKVIPEQRDRVDALRSAKRADRLAARLRAEARRRELALRLEIRRR